jgi:N-formylglutamate amidohydrolase
VRADLLLTDTDLAAELDESTDTATDEIAAAARRHTHLRPTTMINTLSRLVIDPERFPDASEPANGFGRGAVYTRTCTGTPLRSEPYPHAEQLLDVYFRPYADAVTAAVEERLRTCGRAVIIDLHSYPEKPSGFEDPAAARPALCIGTDPVHTPGWLAESTRGAFASLPEFDEIAENTPYGGCYVPLRHYGHDKRVTSVMIELRRDVYLTDPRTPHPERVERIGRALAVLIDQVTAQVAADV